MTIKRPQGMILANFAQLVNSLFHDLINDANEKNDVCANTKSICDAQKNKNLTYVHQYCFFFIMLLPENICDSVGLGIIFCRSQVFKQFFLIFWYVYGIDKIILIVRIKEYCRKRLIRRMDLCCCQVNHRNRPW